MLWTLGDVNLVIYTFLHLPTHPNTLTEHHYLIPHEMLLASILMLHHHPTMPLGIYLIYLVSCTEIKKW